MNSTPHEFVTVDMRGLKTALVARARDRRVSVSVIVRDAVASELGLDSQSTHVTNSMVDRAHSFRLAKVTVRLTHRELAHLHSRSVAAGLSRSAFLAGLIEGAPVLSSVVRDNHVAALVASNAELSTLSRNVRQLAQLLARSQARAAQPYRSMLDTLANDVERHLQRTGGVLSRMGPSHRSSSDSIRRSQLRKEKQDAQL